MTSLAELTDEKKIHTLREIIKGYGTILVGFSGGIDSGFLVKAAVDFLGTDRLLAVTSYGVIHPETELKDARKLTHQLGAPWRKIRRSYLEEEEFRDNPQNRCYHCKKGLFERLDRIAKEEGINEVATGSIKDDRTGHRPGRRAEEEFDIKRPLEEAGLTKRDVRKFGKEAELPFWDKPSNTCLATRIPFGDSITEEKLNRIKKAEAHLSKLGFGGFRVRHHGNIARIELDEDDFVEAIDKREEIVRKLKASGYKFVTLDLEGYRTGSLTEDLD